MSSASISATRLNSYWQIGLRGMNLWRFSAKGTLTAIRDWFRDYKIPDGKPANKFGLGNKPANKLEDAFVT
ncbi:hypothetical protein K7X08_021391 [Anisodus acutangulus]|uniref:Inorganic diphosphatase n=1 Tax=Anisodus acutangulus TaxID=402998 RepID=A0A9Q1LZB4_9SOLA|nr:hypothetical protein K7X08_021391 [Anisodus acutangulus]